MRHIHLGWTKDDITAGLVVKCTAHQWNLEVANGQIWTQFGAEPHSCGKVLEALSAADLHLGVCVHPPERTLVYADAPCIPSCCAAASLVFFSLLLPSYHSSLSALPSTGPWVISPVFTGCIIHCLFFGGLGVGALMWMIIQPLSLH